MDRAHLAEMLRTLADGSRMSLAEVAELTRHLVADDFPREQRLGLLEKAAGHDTEPTCRPARVGQTEVRLEAAYFSRGPKSQDQG